MRDEINLRDDKRDANVSSTTHSTLATPRSSLNTRRSSSIAHHSSLKSFRHLLAALSLISCFLAGATAAEPPQDRLLREHLWHEITSLPRDERPTVGLVLSAGSVRALAHVGVIRVLEDAGFPVDVVSGSSMGAIAGALYAGGMPIDKLWALKKTISLSSGVDFNSIILLRLLLTEKLLSSKKLEKFLHDNIGDRYFHQMAKPFACVAMDLKTGEEIIFREGPLAPAVRASMSLPGVFEPVEYRHRYLVDGAVVDYIPVDAAKLLGAEWVLASVTEGDYTRNQPTNVMSSLEQVLDIRGALLSREQRKQANMIVEPPVGDITYHDSSRGTEAMEKGAIAMKQKLPEAEENLILFTLPRLVRRWRAR